MRETYIVSAVRTPIGRFGGSLKDHSPADLAAHAMEGCLERAGVDGGELDFYVVGNVLRAGQGQLVPRQAAFKAGIPKDIDGMAVDMVCSSGMMSAMTGATQIKAGEADLVLTGGTECMSHAGFYQTHRARWGYKFLMGMNSEPIQDIMFRDGLSDPMTGEAMGEQTERLAEEKGITREELDEIAARAGVELSIGHATGGLFVAGWLRDPHRMIDAIRVQSPIGGACPLDAPLHRFPRADIEKQYRQGGAAAAADPMIGFATFLDGMAEDVPVYQHRFEVLLASGARIELMPPLQPVGLAEARNAVLGSIPPAFLTLPALADCIAPAAGRLRTPRSQEFQMPFDAIARASAEPLSIKTGMPEEHRKQIADGLSKLLADTYTLLGKTHGFHWNVEGPTFHSLHEMFQEQYEDLQDAVDEIAERVRSLGFFPPGSLSQFLKHTTLEDEHGIPDAREMVEQLARDNEQINRTAREVVQLCHEADDTVTEDLMNKRMGAHEKVAWMLRATLARSELVRN